MTIGELARETRLPVWALIACEKDPQADRRLRARVAQALLRWPVKHQDKLPRRMCTRR